MCGIYGYFGSTNNAVDIILSGLKKLDYRGYDSWGIAVLKDNKIFLQKNVGKIETVSKLNLPSGKLGIGHTRWSTTGKVSVQNAHPHFSTDKSFALVHNGIVENYQQLKNVLIKQGFKFNSQTDTEVIVRLIESYQKKSKNLILSAKQTFLKLKGRNTIVLIDANHHRLIAIKNGSPLILGIKNKDYFISSDVLSLGNNISQYYDLNDFEMLTLNNNFQFANIKNNKTIIPKFKKIDFNLTSSVKNNYPHFMIKEIMESPEVINQVINSSKNDLDQLIRAIKKAKTVYTIGSGTAGNAAAQIAYFLRKISHIPAVSLIGANASEYYQFFSSDDLIIVPSQSGETADVLEVLNFAKNKKVKIASYVNMPGSSITRLSDFKFMANTGPEICVMSTKVFTSQIAWGYLLAKTISNEYTSAINNLRQIASSIKKYLQTFQNINQIQKIAQKLLNVKDIFLIGQGENFQIAREGMVKLIEGTYKHAQAIPSGDLKHYAITLIEPKIYTIAISSSENEINNSINEIKSRGGNIILISPDKINNSDFWIKTPKLKETGSIFNIIPLQLLTYYLALKLGNNIDKPRNIAKSVTVK